MQRSALIFIPGSQDMCFFVRVCSSVPQSLKKISHLCLNSDDDWRLHLLLSSAYYWALNLVSLFVQLKPTVTWSAKPSGYVPADLERYMNAIFCLPGATCWTQYFLHQALMDNFLRFCISFWSVAAYAVYTLCILLQENRIFWALGMLPLFLYWIRTLL